MQGMTLSAFLTIIFTTLLGSGGTVGVLQLIAKRRGERAAAAVDEAKADREGALAESDMADAYEKWQKLVDERAARAFNDVKAECDSCKHRLGIAESRQREFETRMHSAETRMYEAEQRERRYVATLRAVVRVVEDGDQALIDDAISSAKEML